MMQSQIQKSFKEGLYKIKIQKVWFGGAANHLSNNQLTVKNEEITRDPETKQLVNKDQVLTFSFDC